MKLTAAERNAFPDSAFALPEYRMFPIHDPGHVHAAAGRVSQALHEGRITPREYARAESRVLAAERHFGMHSTVYPELTAAGLESDGLSDTTKAVAVGGALAGAAALAWWLWPKDGFGAKKAAGAAGRGSHSTQGLHGEGLHGAAQLQLSPSEQAHNDFQAGNSAGQHAGTVVNFHIQALKPELEGPSALIAHNEMTSLYNLGVKPPAGHPQAWKNGFVAGFKLTAQEPPMLPTFIQPHAQTGSHFSYR